MDRHTPVVGLFGRTAVYVTPAGLPDSGCASPSFPVTPGTGWGACALTRARPERATATEVSMFEVEDRVIYCTEVLLAIVFTFNMIQSFGLGTIDASVAQYLVDIHD